MIDRVVLAAIVSVVIVLATGGRLIPWLRAVARQPISADAPARHQSKAGSPTMGGLMMVLAVAAATFVAQPWTPRLGLAFAVFLLFGLIGFADDFLSVRRSRNLGLRARDKLAVQTPVGLAIGAYALSTPGLGDAVAVPGIGVVSLGALYAVFAMLYITFFVNGVNLTDGLDGLAGGTVAIAAFAYAAVALHRGAPELAAFCAAVGGACLGFLWFNAHPARVFMGDTGSMALGGALAAVAILTKTEALLVIVGLVFVVESFSVILQVAYFKSTKGRRIFRSSPLHHHFELAGLAETQIVGRFWILGALAALVGLAMMR
ncbi:MAG: phospho-N-acetylmuramoyl-pentapeptide-transferase [Armatimonadetes bacterium]|nr:phospho-N-acetylmuramoyl-pentapeptide-transferase [Armatimonadota bacterium]